MSKQLGKAEPEYSDPDGNGVGFLRKNENLYSLRRRIDELITGTFVSGARFVMSDDIICELHSICMNGLLPEAGRYRTEPVSLSNGYIPPPAVEVPGLMRDFCDFVNHEWESRDLIWWCSFCLWRINWIHPFVNGNGRTARELGYLAMNIKFGGALPKKNSIIEQIMRTKPDFEAALTFADSQHLLGRPYDMSLSAMDSYVSDILTKQLQANLR